MHGQIVIGPPGSGKSTYCNAVQKLLLNLGRRVVIVNLDPANDYLQYHSDVDISELISLEDVIDKLKLGPNGGLVYCMEVLDKNVEWLHAKLTKICGNQECYFLLDCPGQVELFTHHRAIKNIVLKMQKWGFKLTTVHLVDAHLCSDPGKFISALLTSLSTMYQIELPHVNVLSKVDLIQQYGKLAFGLDYYTEVLDLSYILEHLSDDPFFKKYKSLNKSIVGLVEDSSLVSFIPISVQDSESIQNLMKAVDKASGYIFHSEEGLSTPSSMMSSAMASDLDYFRFSSSSGSLSFSQLAVVEDCRLVEGEKSFSDLIKRPLYCTKSIQKHNYQGEVFIRRHEHMTVVVSNFAEHYYFC